MNGSGINAGGDAGPATIDAETVRELAPHADLVEALRAAFGREWRVPQRWKWDAGPEGSGNQLYLMPATDGETMGVKLASIFAGNNALGLPSIMASVVIMGGRTGLPLAQVEGTEITRRRTAAASALAADYLARPDARRLLIAGTGALATHMAQAHIAVRDYRQIRVWGRDTAKAEQLAEEIGALAGGIETGPAGDLKAAVAEADVISTVTAAKQPIIMGKWLSPGAHLDLVGAHSPDARECDTEAVRFSRVFADVMESCLAEAGELIIPLKEGAIDESHILGDLFDLVGGRAEGRRSAGDITLFKSVGNALEDVAAARFVFDRFAKR